VYYKDKHNTHRNESPPTSMEICA